MTNSASLCHKQIVSYSLHSHDRFKEVDDWTCLSGEMIHRVHGALYDLPESNPDRVRVNLRRRQDGHEVPVYDEDGFRVHRRVPTPGRFRTSGALADLTKVHDLFSPDDRGKKTYHAYPLAFTKRYGNVQASMTLRPYEPVLANINQVLTPPANGDGDEDEHEEWEQQRRGAPVVHGTHCQIYNSISHRVRDQARFHYVQLGLVTSVFSGTTTTTEHGKRRFLTRKEFCSNGLPHQRYANAVQGEDQPQALRIEQTFTVDVHRLRRRHRNGR